MSDIAANSYPNHDTIAVFRKRFVLVQIRMLARSMGLQKLDTVSP